jgi:hypothetical protein
MRSQIKFATALLSIIAGLTLASSASATTLTSPLGSTYTGAFKAESQSLAMHNTSLGITVSCGSSTFEGTVEKHGAASTVTGKLSKVTFSLCGTSDMTVLAPGVLEIHATSGGNGTVTWTGGEITKNVTSLGVSCSYKTNATDIGTLTGSSSGNSILDIASSTIPRTGDSIFCGSSSLWTGSYKFTTPSTLVVDS